jgi:RNA polymerase sigma-70 factor (ECF subfamily)
VERFHVASHPQQGTSLTLLGKLRANEADAWTRLVSLYGPLLHSWCLRSGLQEADRDDIVQDVFRAVNSGIANFRRDRPGGTFRGWLRAIARNRIALYFRERKRMTPAAGGSDAFAQIQQMADSVDSLSDDDTQEELTGLYRRACELVRGEFEDRTWQMFWRTVVGDRSPTDVAAEFGVTQVAVRKAKSRVLARLRAEIGDLIA